MEFRQALEGRILILDGAMGTMVQRLGLSGGDNELLNLTHPDAIVGIHKDYIDSGADIIETNSFGANRISQAEYGRSDDAARMAFEAARLARMAADGAPRKVWVAGSVGPTGKSLSLASDVSDPAFREYSFTEMEEVYREEIEALAKGGADIILVETCFDALNVKAAIRAMEVLGCKLPLIVSATVSDRSGRTLTGQTLESFYRSIEHAPTLAAFGINCALGASAMTGLVRDIAAFSSHPLIFYPNAGIPDESGNYCDSPAAMAEVFLSLARAGIINIAGGCCGSTPDHIRAISQALRDLSPGTAASAAPGRLCVSGLDTVTVDKSRNFTNVGERTNVTGSRKFARLIAKGSYDEALQVAATQIEGGAGIIDINMDDPMLDAPACMGTYIRYINSDPSVARAALMIDSSDWDTVLAGLRNAQGKSIVNSISLKDGEEVFLRKAREIRSYGAAMVVMAFDENGQAESFQRKIEICRRSYDLLTSAGIPACEIIFDCNILTVGTGIPEHSRFGIDFIEAVRWIKSNLPGALTTGGVSNLSFAFRGNNPVREAMHSVFLYHAIRAGLDMAIVNPGMLQIYDHIDPPLRSAIEAVIFDSDPDATGRLVALASGSGASGAVDSGSGASGDGSAASRADAPARLRDAVINGNAASVREDALDALSLLGDAVSVIEGPLMAGMEKVGELFADGRMFLPQVMKSAKMMREAIEVLEPHLKGTRGSGKRPVFVIATVQGDVHDIGKKITASVLMCSGFEVHDLGVMVPCGVILDKAEEYGAAIIGVSGLITPSLSRMEELCREMSSRGMTTPLFVGGAAATAIHTAVKLAPLYERVYYGADSSATAVSAKKYIQDPEGFMREEALKRDKLLALRGKAVKPVCKCCSPGLIKGQVFDDIPLTFLDAGNLMRHFDWKLFRAVCGVPLTDEGAASSVVQGVTAASASSAGLVMRAVTEVPEGLAGSAVPEGQEEQAVPAGLAVKEEALADLSRMKVRFCVRFFEKGLSGKLATYLRPGTQLGVFAIRADNGGMPDDDLVAHSACVTLAEAASTYLHRLLSSKVPEGVNVLLPAVGYPDIPDHSLKQDILSLLPPEMEISLTEGWSMVPEASICGLIFAGKDLRYGDIEPLRT